MSVEVIKVETIKQLKEFVNYNYELYKDCPYAVPELYEDALNTLLNHPAVKEKEIMTV